MELEEQQLWESMTLWCNRHSGGQAILGSAFRIILFFFIQLLLNKGKGRWRVPYSVIYITLFGRLPLNPQAKEFWSRSLFSCMIALPISHDTKTTGMLRLSACGWCALHWIHCFGVMVGMLWASLLGKAAQRTCALRTVPDNLKEMGV